MLPFMNKLLAQKGEDPDEKWTRSRKRARPGELGESTASATNRRIVAVPMDCRGIRWQLLTKTNGTIDIRLDFWSNGGYDGRSEWHESPTHSISVEQLIWGSVPELILTAMIEVARACIERDQTASAELEVMYASGASITEPEHLDRLYDLLSPDIIDYIDASRSAANWLPDTELMFAMSTSQTKLEVFAKLPNRRPKLECGSTLLQQ